MNINKRLLLILFVTILSIFCINGKVEAAYSATNKTIKSGDSVSIIITSTEKLENFDIECTDVGGLIYDSCSTSVQGAIANSAAKKITYAAIGGEATTLGTYKFKAPEVENKISYTVKFDVNGVNVPSTITVEPKEEIVEKPPVEQEKPTTPSTPDTPSTPSTPETPTEKPVEKPKEKSKNAYLATLGVRIKAELAEELGVETSAYDFSGFSKTKKTYNVTIPNDVDYLKVEYRAADSNAKVSIKGNSGFEVGSNNKIDIKVTAEDGKTTETYTIKVTKLAAEEKKPGNVIEDNEGLFLTSLSLEGIELFPEFKKDTYSYNAILTDSLITEVNVNAVANKENASIEISGNTNLVVGENTINIVVKQDETALQTVYQITITKEQEEMTNTETTTEEKNEVYSFIGNIDKYVIISIGLILLIIVTIIVLIILLRRENQKIEDEQEKEESLQENKVIDNIGNEEKQELVEKITIETETNNKRRNRRREKGKHSK